MADRERSRPAARVAAVLAFAAVATTAFEAVADNPIVQTNYTADPAPMLYEGRLYLYTSHDEDVTVNNFFTMNDWKLYSTVDMVNWTDHGTVASFRTFSWGTGDAWAPHGAHRNGKVYLYVPLNNSTGTRIGVAVANHPVGPFTDALGKALISSGAGNIDPNVFIDDDGQAYLYWGNPDLWYVKLNTDMISYPGSPIRTNLTTAGFGARSNSDRATAYEEGPWFYKRGSLYYLVYPADGTPEKISYTTSSGPTGPWMFRGDIMAKQGGAGASFTNHPGVIDYNGHSYFFYHNGALPGGGGYKRSVCVEEFKYNADGTIPTIKTSTAGPAAIAVLNPYVQVEAETIAFSSGLKTEVCSEGGIDVTQISTGDYIKVKNVDFGTGAVTFQARVASAGSGGNIELRLDSQTGTLLGTCTVSGTGGAQSWMTVSCPVTGATGAHDLFLGFTGGSGASLFNFNWWRFAPRDAPDGGVPDAGDAGSADRDATGGGGRSGSGGTGGIGGAAGAAGGARGGAAGLDGGAAGAAGGARGGAGGAAGLNGGAAGQSGTNGGATGGTTGGAGGGSSGSAGRGANGGSDGSGAGGTGGTSGGGGAETPTAGCGCQTTPSANGIAPLGAMFLLVASTLRRRHPGAARETTRTR